MRNVNLTRNQFDNYIFPAWANAQSPGDPEVVMRVTRKLKSVSVEKPLDEFQRKLRDEGKVVFADRTLRDEDVVMLLEEDEWRTLRDMFHRALPNFLPLAMEDAFYVNEELKSAQKADVEAK